MLISLSARARVKCKLKPLAPLADASRGWRLWIANASRSHGLAGKRAIALCSTIMMNDDEKNSRCAWAESDPLMRAYHDTEWGIPIRDSRLLWETLMLEGFQAGLAWIIVLRKREAFRKAFSGFDPASVARFDERDVLRLMADAGIIRARAKIEATILGAQIYCEMENRGEHFSDFCWSFTEGQTIQGDGESWITSSALSERISKDLKRKGFKFVGPTIVYAWMQAVGIVNDHSTGCFRREQVKRSI